MATAQMPPTPVAPPGQGSGGPPPNPVGQAVSQSPNQGAELMKVLQSSVQGLASFTKAIEPVNAHVAEKFKSALKLIVEGLQELKGGAAGQQQGPVPPPGPQAQQTPQTPEAT